MQFEIWDESEEFTREIWNKLIDRVRKKEKQMSDIKYVKDFPIKLESKNQAIYYDTVKLLKVCIRHTAHMFPDSYVAHFNSLEKLEDNVADNLNGSGYELHGELTLYRQCTKCEEWNLIEWLYWFASGELCNDCVDA